MSIKRLFAILFIFGCTVFAWLLLGGALNVRTQISEYSTAEAVRGVWGPAMTQEQPSAYYQAPGVQSGRAQLRPSSSKVETQLHSDPKQRGLLWYRTYDCSFKGEYTFENPTPIPQTIFVQFALPSADASYNQFSYTLNGRPTTANVTGGKPITEAVTLPPNEKAVLVVSYKTRGLDHWGYSFGQESRVRNFLMQMKTDFKEIDFPPGTGSPTARQEVGDGYKLEWNYPDEIGARDIGMEMPNILNPGPTATRMTFFAPVSLLFFFAVLVILCLLRGVNLHPMNFFFLSAGCFAFQLLFAYLVDLIPINIAFTLSALISLTLVSGYLGLVAGWRFARWVALAQFIFMVLFSYSFFFDGLTGLTITIGAIVTLALLMITTAKVDWAEKFVFKKRPPLNEKAAH